MKENALNWFEIFTADLSRAKAFYEKILNRSMVTIPKGDGGEGAPCCEMAMFPFDLEKGGIGGAIVKMEGCQPGPGGSLVYLNVEGDLDGVIARIPEAGGKVIKERMAIPPHGFIAIFEDSEGNLVGLHSLL